MFAGPLAASIVARRFEDPFQGVAHGTGAGAAIVALILWLMIAAL